MVGIVVRIDIAIVVAQLFHELGGRIAQMERHVKITRGSHILQGRIDAHVGRIALLTRGQINRSLSQRDTPLGPTYFLHSIKGCVGDEQRVGIGQTNVLGGRNDETAGNELWVLAAFYQTGQPIEGRLRVAAADAFDEGRDDVVVHLAAFVVGHGRHLQLVGDACVVYYYWCISRGCRHYEVEDAEEFAGIATAVAQQGLVLAHLNLAVAQDDVLMKGSVKERQQVIAVKALQHIDSAAREEGTDDLKGGIFGSSSDERDGARFDGGEE